MKKDSSHPFNLPKLNLMCPVEKVTLVTWCPMYTCFI